MAPLQKPPPPTSTTSPSIPLEHPSYRVLIVGGGIGGLTLANLLQKAGTDYLIFEKASAFKALGAAINLNTQTFAFLDQLGLYQDLEKVSVPFGQLNVFSLDPEKEFGHQLSYKGMHSEGIDFQARYGYASRILSRPDLIKVLLSRIEPEKLKMKTRIISIQQDQDGVILKASDGSIFYGDLVVGSDGCYSAVREAMLKDIAENGYKDDIDDIRENEEEVGDSSVLEPTADVLSSATSTAGVSIASSLRSSRRSTSTMGNSTKKKTKKSTSSSSSTSQQTLQRLLESDRTPLNYSMECVVGVTNVLDPEKFPILQQSKSEFQVILVKEKAISIWLMPLGGKIAWMINEVLSKERKAKLVQFFQKSIGKNANVDLDWGLESAWEMCSRFQDYETPLKGVKLVDIFKETPTDLISKTLLEEKFFEHWQQGRIVLLGDACHKTLPFGGVGAMNAMHDALEIANLLYDMPTASYTNIRKVLVTYHQARKSHGLSAVQGSAGASQLFHGQGLLADAMRKLVLDVIPKKLIQRHIEKLVRYSPLVRYLPRIQVPLSTNGTKSSHQHQAFQQTYSVRYMMERKEIQEEAAALRVVVARAAAAVRQRRRKKRISHVIIPMASNRSSESSDRGIGQSGGREESAGIPKRKLPVRTSSLKVVTL